VKPRLLDPERDAAFTDRLPPHGADLLQDLELRTLIDAMARGDATIAGVATKVLLDPLVDPGRIAYRQAILRDGLANPDGVRPLYDLAVAAIARGAKTSWTFMPRRPESIVRHSVEVLEAYVHAFQDLRRHAERHRGRCASVGLREFYAMVECELADDYLRGVQHQLRELRFGSGVRVGARLGAANKGTDYRVRPAARRGALADTALGRWWADRRGVPEAGLTLQLEPRDESGLRALEELRDRSLERVAEVLAEAAESVVAFFCALRDELAFYVGSLNLHARLTELGAASCIPEPVTGRGAGRRAEGLYDPCLALRVGHPVVDNDLAAEHATLVLVTGANQGGKTTMLRSIGLAQLMMQSGMPVAARSYRAGLSPGVFTHFKREEDATMTSGKLDEELARMSAIVDRLEPGSLVLLNESFAATNEREGSEIADQLAEALTEAGVTVCFVTHLGDFAGERYARRAPGTLCLRAERRPDGARTFKLREGAPQRTSHGADLYLELFGDGGEGEATPGTGVGERGA
jgi:hypothetical protein